MIAGDAARSQAFASADRLARPAAGILDPPGSRLSSATDPSRHPSRDPPRNHPEKKREEAFCIPKDAPHSKRGNPKRTRLRKIAHNSIS